MRLSNHHKLVSDGLDQINISESRIGGQLGKKTSARYRVYMRLDRYYNENKDTLFANDILKRTIEDIYRYPLKELAKETFNRQLKAGIDDTDLARRNDLLKVAGGVAAVSFLYGLWTINKHNKSLP